MKIDSTILGLALADFALPRDDQPQLMELADYVLRHPTSKLFHNNALAIMGIDPDLVPGEHWTEEIPPEGVAAEKLKAAITALNEHWKGGRLQRTVVVRNLAWQATQLARRLEKESANEAAVMVRKNGGSTAGMLKAFVSNPVSRGDLLARFESKPD